FYLGVACNWVLFVDLKHWHFALVIACALLLLGIDMRPYVVTGILSALFIYGVGCIQGLSSWLCARPLIYLGSISYSLYLIHPEVGWSTISLLKHFFGTANSVWIGVLYFLIAIAVSIVAAHILWRLVELPSNLFAKRFGARSRAPVPAPSQ
ncbi:MAG: acyltransferase family protein, partial [Pseudomonadales bacterium]